MLRRGAAIDAAQIMTAIDLSHRTMPGSPLCIVSNGTMREKNK
jgi:hypothetical protein